MGKWYVVEVLEHKVDPLKPLSGSYVVNSCPIVKLRAIENSSKFFSSLRLLWSEEMGNLEYTFRIPDITRKPGFWISNSHQNGKHRSPSQTSFFFETIEIANKERQRARRDFLTAGTKVSIQLNRNLFPFRHSYRKIWLITIVEKKIERGTVFCKPQTVALSFFIKRLSLIGEAKLSTNLWNEQFSRNKWKKGSEKRLVQGRN